MTRHLALPLLALLLLPAALPLAGAVDCPACLALCTAQTQGSGAGEACYVVFGDSCSRPVFVGTTTHDGGSTGAYAYDDGSYEGEVVQVSSGGGSFGVVVGLANDCQVTTP